MKKLNKKCVEEKKSQEEIEKIRKAVMGKQYFYDNNPKSKKNNMP